MTDLGSIDFVAALSMVLIWIDSHFMILLVVGAALFVLYLLAGMTGGKRRR